MVNLIDRKGSQNRIGIQFSKLFENLKDLPVEYTWFDFHGECKKMKWENLSKLVRIVKDQLENWAHFTATVRLNSQDKIELLPQNIKVHSRQNGYFRTNCMDCLDRTNVVQSVFSRNIMHNQLHFFGHEQQPSGRPFEEFEPQLEEAFRAIWTDNADRLSIMYTGTPALKTDFTRTGKRSHKGAMNDGKNSLHRYYINNFTDGYNHDCLDLALGKLRLEQMPAKTAMTPIKQYMVGMMMSLFLANQVLNTYVPAEEDNTYNSILYNLVYGLIVFATYTVIK